MSNLISTQDIIDDVLLVRQTHNPINISIYIKYGKYSTGTIDRNFGNWTNLMNKLKLPVKRNNISKKDIIEDVLKVFNKYGNTTREFYLANGTYSRAPIKRLFGGWNNLLKELKFDINMHKKVSKKEVVKAIKKLYKKYGYITAVLQRKELGYSQPVIDRIFGSFSNMLIELEIRQPYGKSITDEEVKQSLMDIYEKHKHISCLLINEYCVVTDATIINRFGSLQNICDELDIPLYLNDDISKLSKFILSIVSEILNENPKYEYTFNWLVNSDTNRKLRADAYYPNHNIIIEVDGLQHFEYKNDFFFKTIEKFNYACYLDKLKETLVEQHNIKFLRLTSKDNYKTINNKLSFLLNTLF